MRPRFNYAKNVGRKFYYDNCKDIPYPINLIELVYTLDIGFENTTICGEDGFIMYKPDKKKYKIVIDYSGKSLRKRFTLAHEIGHIILKHFEQFDVYSLSDEEKDILDIEANVFAGELLMPYLQIKTMYCGVKSMVKLFNVTEDAMKTRLMFLGHKIEEPEQMVAERPVVKYSLDLVHVDDDMMRQVHALHEKWLYDF